MKITWHGQSCFKIRTKKTTLITDPFSKETGIKPPHYKGDIVTVSHGHSDHNNVSAIKGDPFLIEDPGEYDLKGITINGVASFHDSKQGKERGSNTIFVIETEDIKICHLGDLGQKELTNEQLEGIGDIDILMIPVGGVYTIGAEKAMHIINQIEPEIVIPMHYKIPKLKIQIKPVDDFLKEIGKKPEKVDELTIKAKDIPKQKENMRIILMERT